MYIFYNPNPDGLFVGDCVVRAISKIMDVDWESAYISVCIRGLRMHDMPSSNSVWGSFLKRNGFVRRALPNTCPDCYKVIDFIADHPDGSFIVATGSHVVAVIDGDYYDAWDSGNEVPIYYWTKEDY